MKKLMSYLMLLLCIFMLPLKIYALESAVEAGKPVQSKEVYDIGEELEELSDSSNDDSIMEENKEGLGSEENVNELEDSSITSEEVVEENTIDGENDLVSILSEQNTEDDSSILENETINEETTEENVAEGESQEIGEEVNALKTISLENVNITLLGSTLPQFTAKVVDSDIEKYAILYEVWYSGDAYYSSSEELNATYSEKGELLDNLVADEYYTYQLGIRINKDYELVYDEINAIEIVINGNKYWASVDNLEVDEETGDTIVNLSVQESFVATDTNYEYIDEVLLEDVNLNITDGRSPVYSAKSMNDIVVLDTEFWRCYPIQEEEIYNRNLVNYRDSGYLNSEYEREFTTFSKDNVYHYGIIVSLKEGYRFASTNGDFSIIRVIINGEEYEGYTDYFGQLNEDGTYFYYIDLDISYTPAEETYPVLDGGNTTINTNYGDTLAIRIDADYKKFQNVYIDGVIVKDGYTITEGSTIVTFTNEFIKTLSVGTHEILVTFDDGLSSYTTLTINEVSNDNEVITPPVDNTSNPYSGIQPPKTKSSYVKTIPDTVVDSLIIQPKEDEDTKEVEKDSKDTDNKIENKDKDTDLDDENFDDEDEEESSSNSGIVILIIVILLAVLIAIPLLFNKKEE